MGPVRQPGSAAPSRTAPGSWLVALGVAVLGALGLALLPSCSSPTSPSRPFFVNPQIIDETDCTGVPVTSDPCDTSPPPTWNFPDLPCPTRAEVEEINREIPVKVNSDVSAGVLACRARDGSVDLTVVQNNIYQSLLFLRRVRIDMRRMKLEIAAPSPNRPP